MTPDTNGDGARIPALRGALVAWYAQEARELPWRGTEDPYRVWISEIVLQQTRVETAIGLFERFVARFPDVAALAAASIDEVLKAWEGFGYYRRAHNLHRAAQEVVDRHGGRVPASVSELRALPGIGPYTAAAVASIAFGLDEPALDGNLLRVLSRLFRIDGDPRRAATRRELGERARVLFVPGEAATFNQALMDLGARLCVPRSPRCHQCPVASWCDAHRDGQEALYPRRGPRRAVPHVDVVAGVVWDVEPLAEGGRLLIAKRHEHDMLGGLWEFPGGRVEDGESYEEALRRELAEELGIEVRVDERLMELQHAYTHFRITLHIYHCRHVGGRPRAIDCAEWRWVSPGDLDAYAFPKADRRILDRLIADVTARESA